MGYFFRQIRDGDCQSLTVTGLSYVVIKWFSTPCRRKRGVATKDEKEWGNEGVRERNGQGWGSKWNLNDFFGYARDEKIEWNGK